MSEEVLLASLRAETGQWDSDLKKAMKSASDASRAIADALGGIDNSIKGLPQEIAKVNSELKNVEAQANRTKKSSSGFADALKGMKGLLGTLGITASVAGLVAFGKSAFTASQQIQAVERQLVKLTGSQQAAGAEMAFIREETSRLSQNLAAGAQGFVQIANAAKGTILEGEGVRQTFSAISEITAANNLSNEQYKTLLTQVTQGINKQKFELEDLKSISEAGVPIFQAMGKALNVKPDQLFKAISAGKIDVKTLTLTIAELRKQYGGLAEEAANTIPGQFKRGFNDIMNGFSDMIGGVLESKKLNEAFNNVAGGISIASVFPSKEEVKKGVDTFVNEFSNLISLIATVFEIIDKVVMSAWNTTLGRVKKEWNDFTATFAKIDTVIGAAWAKVTGLEDPSKQVKDLNSEINKLGPTVDGLTSGVTGKGVLADWLGIDSMNQENSLKILRDRLRETAGLKDETAESDIDREKRVAEERKKVWEKAKKDEEAFIKKMGIDRVKITQGILKPGDDKALKEARKKELEETKKQVEAVNDIMKALSAGEAERVKQLTEDLNRAAAAGQPARDALQDKKDASIESYEHLKENAQDILGTAISDAFQSDMGNIRDVFDNILGALTDMVGQIASKKIISGTFDKAINWALGPSFKTDNKIGGALGSLLNFKLGGSGATGIGSATVGQAGMVAGAGFAGGQVGSSVGGAIAGKTGAIVGGVLGGAAAGAIAGSIVPVIGTAVGAVAGAVIGGVTAAIQAGAFTKPNKETLGVRTNAPSNPPGDLYREVSKRSPFGIISLFEESDTSGIVAQSALTLISETDTAIAAHLDETQRAIVENYFQTAIPEGNLVSAEEGDDAMAKLVAQRYYQAITALAGQDIAETVVGSPFNASNETIQSIQQRANQALEVLKAIEGFKEGPLSNTASAIKAINEQFQALEDRATTLGLPTDEILAEQQRQIAEVTTNFNDTVAQEILQMTDPIAAQWADLDKKQAQRIKEAQGAGADMVAVERLNALERAELAKQIAGSNEAINSGLQGLIASKIMDFANQDQSGPTQQINALKDSFIKLRDEAIAAGFNVEFLTGQYTEQANAIRTQAQEGFLSALFSITDPFAAAMIAVNQQIREFQKLADEGIIPQGFVDQFAQVAAEQARFQEAMRLASGGGAGPQDQFQAMLDDFLNRGTEMSATEQQIAAVEEEFQNLADALTFLGLPIDELRAAADRQIEHIRETADEISDSADLAARIFTFANQSQSSATQQIEALKQSFIELRDEAIAAGVNVQFLTRSYTEQANAIRTAAQEGFLTALFSITDPFAAAMIGINQQIREFQKLAEEGIIPQAFVDQFAQIAEQNARFQEALRLGGGASTPEQQFQDMIDDFIERGDDISDTERQIREVEEQFQNLADALIFLGLPTDELREAADRQIQQIREDAAEADRDSGANRAEEIKALKERMQDFVDAGRSDFGNQLSALQKQFEELRDEAIRLGQSTGALTAAWHQQAAEIRQLARESVQSAIFAFTNPFAAAMISINQQVREFQKLAADGLIPQEWVDQFERLARRDARYQEASRLAGGGGDARDQFQSVVDAFVDKGRNISDTASAIAAVREEFENLAAALRFLGLPTDEIERSRNRQIAQIRREEAERRRAEAEARREEIKAFRQRMQDFINAGRSDFGNQLIALKRSFIELKEEAKRLHQSTRGLAGAYAQQVAEIRRLAAESVRSAIYDIVNPFQSGIMQINNQVREFRKLAADGLIPRATVERFRRLALGNATIQRALEQMSGGQSSPMQQVGQAFSDFILAASPPLSQASQEYQELTNNFRGLIDAARTLGLSTKALQWAYKEQAKAIREQAIEAIDQQLEARRNLVTQIDDYLRELRVGDELPAQMRLDEARTQFRQQIVSGDVQGALEAAETYRSIARENWGSSQAFFGIRTEIEDMLTGMRNREQAQIEAERNRLIRQEQMQQRQIEIGRSSMAFLLRISNDGSATSRGINELIRIGQVNANISAETRNLLLRLVGQRRA